MKYIKKSAAMGVAVLMLGFILAACDGSSGNATNAASQAGRVTANNVSDQQAQIQGTTAKVAQQLTNAEPYPVDTMKDSAERANLKARLIRLNDPNRIGYVYGLSSTGQVMAFWTIRGKISSMGSQLTNTQNNEECSGGSGACAVSVDSMGDDGTYGPEECSTQGISFFTADTDALVEWCGPWMYSDAPLKLATAPIITVTAQQPTSPVPAGGTTKGK